MELWVVRQLSFLSYSRKSNHSTEPPPSAAPGRLCLAASTWGFLGGASHLIRRPRVSACLASRCWPAWNRKEQSHEHRAGKQGVPTVRTMPFPMETVHFRG